MRPGQNPVLAHLFEQAEERAEWLVALLRIAISTCLAVVLWLGLMQVQEPLNDVLLRQLTYAALTMAAYLLLGFGFLGVIRTGLFQRWMVWPSALIDCVFILLGMWLSIANLGLSGAHFSAFPTIWLVPVVLACGALRFNPALQATMALVLLVGILLLLSVTVPKGQQSEAEALAFLFGLPPNLIRTAMIALAALVLVVASMRIRSLLWRSITESEARGQLTRFLPGELEGQLARVGLDRLRNGAQQRMAVMFVDVRGFTHLSESMEPPALSAFLGGYRQCIARATDQTGGIVDKFIGDGAMVVFDDADGTAAARAVTCARTLLTFVQDWQADVDVGIGVHIGDVYTGVVGDEGRLEFTVLGDVVNVAARLEAATKTERVSVLVSDDVMRAAGTSGGDWRATPDLQLPGRRARVNAWALVAG